MTRCGLVYCKLTAVILWFWIERKKGFFHYTPERLLIICTSYTVFSLSKLFSGDTITPTWTHLLHPLPSSSNLAISPHWVCSSSSLLTPLGSLWSPTQPWHSSRADNALYSFESCTVIKAWKFQNIIYTPQGWIFDIFRRDFWLYMAKQHLSKWQPQFSLSNCAGNTKWCYGDTSMKIGMKHLIGSLTWSSLKFQ